MPTFVFIHGARATSASFNYIRTKLDDHFPDRTDVLLSYGSNESFLTNLDKMVEELDNAGDELFFIGHSLGGIYAFHLANSLSERTIGGVTISTPYGGSVEAYFLRFLMPQSALLADIVPSSAIMQCASSNSLTVPWANIVTTGGGSPFIVSRNDGVVTYSSMTANQNMNFFYIEENHYEILLSTSTIGIIKTQYDYCIQQHSKHQSD